MSMDREDFESDEAWKNYLDQQMTQKFSAADFANARFAKHPRPESVDAQFAARMNTNSHHPWLLDGVPGNTDAAMARDGWVPVPTKPTITARELRNVNGVGYVSGFIDGFLRSGGEIIPDQEPTDEELLAGIIRGIDDWQSITSPELLAKYLNTAGVTPPNVKGN